MIKTLQLALKQDRESTPIPKSVQDAIPISRIWPDGMFQFGSKFSKTIRFTDINVDRTNKFELLCSNNECIFFGHYIQT